MTTTAAYDRVMSTEDGDDAAPSGQRWRDAMTSKPAFIAAFVIIGIVAFVALGFAIFIFRTVLGPAGTSGTVTFGPGSSLEGDETDATARPVFLDAPFFLGNTTCVANPQIVGNATFGRGCRSLFSPFMYSRARA